MSQTPRAVRKVCAKKDGDHFQPLQQDKLYHLSFFPQCVHKSIRAERVYVMCPALLHTNVLGGFVELRQIFLAGDCDGFCDGFLGQEGRMFNHFATDSVVAFCLVLCLREKADFVTGFGTP